MRLIKGDCVEKIKEIASSSVDLTVTSPPYDNLREYKGAISGWSFDRLKELAYELYRATKDGGVVVWIVGDQTENGSESGTSFKQALWFMECGFKLHDTMIYHKSGLTMNHRRYEQEFEYMFVFSKGRPKTFNPIMVPTKYPEKPTARKNSFYGKTDETSRKARSGKKRKPVGVEKIKGNIWYYPTGRNHSTMDDYAFAHPAIFPEKLAEDHIASWSNVGDVVLDPFMGSGTTGKMAILNGRDFIGIEMQDEYFDIAKRRIKDAQKEKESRLF